MDHRPVVDDVSSPGYGLDEKTNDVQAGPMTTLKSKTLTHICWLQVSGARQMTEQRGMKHTKVRRRGSVAVGGMRLAFCV